MNQESQKFLLKLARRTLGCYFSFGKKLQIESGELPNPELAQEQGCFVTLHKKDGQLRGCIGHIEPLQALYLDVIDNALSAAFEDNRFLPLQADEMDDVVIEISVLSVPEKLEYESSKDLVSKLEALKPGVILSKALNQATYLPQVWEDLPDVSEFLSSLCLKAGLGPEDWKHGSLVVMTYQAEVFHE